MDNPRPASVTVISIIVIILNSLSILGLGAFLAVVTFMGSSPQMAQARQQLAAQGGMSFIVGFGLTESIISLVLAAFMLQGRNWARQIFIIVQVAGLIAGWIVTGFHASSIVGVIITGVIIYFLTRPDAAAYFTYEPSQQSGPTTTPP